MNNLTTKNLTTIALMTALMCIAGPIVVPLPFTPVPISLTNLVIYIACCILGCKKGTISLVIYLIIGSIGLPVFGGFSGGLSKLAGPTGGYLIGFIFCSLLTGLFVDKFEDKIYMYSVGMILGTIVCYGFGTGWLAMQLNLSLIQALFMGVIPYLLGDAIKIVVSTLLGFSIRSKLKSLSLIEA